MNGSLSITTIRPVRSEGSCVAHATELSGVLVMTYGGFAVRPRTLTARGFAAASREVWKGRLDTLPGPWQYHVQ